MKKFFLLFFILFVCITNHSFAQANQWVWLHGSNVTGSAGNFGTQNVPKYTNEPPAVYEPCEWRDTSGKFWFYGGRDNNLGFHNDLWKYDPVTDVWTWIKGTASVGDPGVYGVKGMPSALNNPPSVGFGVPTWVDLNNNLWLYGGGGVGNTDDLWMYNIASNEWTWMKGEDSSLARGVYGIQGIQDTANHPSTIEETAATWTDANGDLWFFGGGGYLGPMNNMWRYNIASNTWTWMKGPGAQAFQFSKYGTKGVEKATNIPGSRYAYSHWKDKNGNFWLFGGFDGLGSDFNDMWKYNPATNNWTWMSGTNILYTQGSFGSKCTYASTNVPYSRFENRACWTDPNGDFWIFGGGVDSNNVFSITWNDLWKYCVGSNQWIWVSGDSVANPAGSWGVRGVANASNIPNGRAGAVGWSNGKGGLYLFGGSTKPYSSAYNDLWKYTIDTTCAVCAAVVPPVAAFKSSDSSICQFECINFTDRSTNATAWSWSFTGATPSSSTDKNPQNICYLTSGIYNVRLIASNAFGKDTADYSNFIHVSPAPPTPTITRSDDTLYCSIDPSYSSFQWYMDSVLINGATQTFLVISQGGNYNVRVTNEYGCSVAVGINIILGINSLEAANGFTIQPNPAHDLIIINKPAHSGPSLFTIYNTLGELIFRKQLNEDVVMLSIADLAPGIYFAGLAGEKRNWIIKFVKSY